MALYQDTLLNILGGLDVPTGGRVCPAERSSGWTTAGRPTLWMADGPGSDSLSWDGAAPRPSKW
jgi:hypothetical protein